MEAVIPVNSGLVNTSFCSDICLSKLLGMEVLGLAQRIIDDPNKVGCHSILKVLSSKSCDLVMHVAIFIQSERKPSINITCMFRSGLSGCKIIYDF